MWSAQTTLSHFDWQDVLEASRERFPDLWLPGRDDLCYATTNRQSAVKAIAPTVDVFIVVGSENSSNTWRWSRSAWRRARDRALDRHAG